VRIENWLEGCGPIAYDDEDLFGVRNHEITAVGQRGNPFRALAKKHVDCQERSNLNALNLPRFIRASSVYRVINAICRVLAKLLVPKQSAMTAKTDVATNNRIFPIQSCRPLILRLDIVVSCRVQSFDHTRVIEFENATTWFDSRLRFIRIQRVMNGRATEKIRQFLGSVKK
jgi:hypothetical protein